MKKTVWANPAKEWDGFHFGAYFLDSQKVWTLPITQERLNDGKTEQVSTTVGKMYVDLAKRNFEVEPSLFGGGFKAIADHDELQFSGPSFNCEILREILQLKKEGVEPFSAQWFWYDSDSCREDPIENYNFFVVYNDRIVREDVSFGDYANNGFDPDVFTEKNDSDSIWFNDSEWQTAWQILWYRKFYRDTQRGQLMVLRADEPILYHYERAPIGNVERITQNQSVTLLRAYKLLWVALPLLVALAFPSTKVYMAIAAIALGVDFLWLCWATRTK